MVVAENCSCGRLVQGEPRSLVDDDVECEVTFRCECGTAWSRYVSVAGERTPQFTRGEIERVHARAHAFAGSPLVSPDCTCWRRALEEIGGLRQSECGDVATIGQEVASPPCVLPMLHEGRHAAADGPFLQRWDRYEGGRWSVDIALFPFSGLAQAALVDLIREGM